MFQKKIITLVAFLLLISLSAIAQIDQTPDSSRVNPEQLELPENVKTVLIHEMTTITRLMGHLLEYLVQGDSENASLTAIEIRNTNLRQEFNGKEIREIMIILPQGFIKMDRGFHGAANNLAQAVDSNDFKTAMSLYNEMTQSCINCHSTYANERFENLKSE